MKTALITGASGGIGSAISNRLAAAGWSLYLHYHHHEGTVSALAAELQSRYPKQDFFVMQADLTNEASVDVIKERLFGVQAIVFAHGTASYGMLETVSTEEMDHLWKQHVKVPILLVQALQEKLFRHSFSRIVFISSVYGEVGSSNEVLYSTVKGAQIAFVKAYSKEVATTGLTVNAICPGAIDTDMNQQFEDEERKKLVADIPMNRLGFPCEIAYWVSVCLEEESQYLTGQSLTVSGGWLN